MEKNFEFLLTLGPFIHKNLSKSLYFRFFQEATVGNLTLINRRLSWQN